MTYAIKDWEKTFENYRSREVENLRYVSLPVRQDREAFRRLLSTRSGREAYTVFIVLVQIAARCSPRGVLRDERGDITPPRVAAVVPIPESVIRDAMQLLATQEIGWLVPRDEAAPSAPAPTGQGQSESTDRAPTAHRPPIDRARRYQTRPDQRRLEETRPESGTHSTTSERARAPVPDSQSISGLAGGQGPEPEGTEALRRALLRRSIGDPALSAFMASPNARAADVEAVYAEVLGDPTVRDATKVLIARLALRWGVDLPRRTTPREPRARKAPGPMAGDLTAQVQRIMSRATCRAKGTA